MRTLGLTGGIGSGKSTVASLLAEHGAAVVDADALSRGLTAPGGAAIDAIRTVFGPAFITPDGALDRDRMRQTIFAEPAARQRLEAIVHPLVRHATEQRLDAARRQGAACAVLDIPLLVESGQWAARVDRVLVVDCSVATQVERVQRRSGLDEAAVLRIVAAQASRAQRRAAADAVVFNDGCTLAQLRCMLSRIARYLGL